MSISRGVREGEFSQDVASYRRTGGQKKTAIQAVLW